MSKHGLHISMCDVAGQYWQACGHLLCTSKLSACYQTQASSIRVDPHVADIVQSICPCDVCCPPSCPASVFTSSVGKESTVAVALLCVWPIIIEVCGTRRGLDRRGGMRVCVQYGICDSLVFHRMWG